MKKEFDDLFNEIEKLRKECKESIISLIVVIILLIVVLLLII